MTVTDGCEEMMTRQVEMKENVDNITVLDTD